MAHIDTYVSPTSWTDLEMDWENPNSQKACYVDALLQAVKERGSVRGGTGYSFSHIAPDALLSYQTLWSIHLAILNMIPHFLDPENPLLFTTGIIKETLGDMDYYTDFTYGSYQGGTISDSQTMNYLTLPLICEKLELTEILYPQPYARNNSAWLKQSYGILNLMKYTSLQDYIAARKYLSFRGRTRYKVTLHPEDEHNKSSDVTTDWSEWTESTQYANCYFYSDNESVSGFDYYYAWLAGETEMKFGIHYPTSWKLLGYLQNYDVWNAGYRKYFKSNDVANPGWFYRELGYDFQVGLQEFDFSFGSVTELLPLPSTTTPPDNSYNSAIYYPNDYLIEHDFKFKAEGA